MTIYSVQPRDRIFVKSHGFLSFAKNSMKFYEMLHQVREIDIMHSIIVKKGVFFFITTTEEIAQDIKQFFYGQTLLFLEWTQPSICVIYG